MSIAEHPKMLAAHQARYEELSKISQMDAPFLRVHCERIIKEIVEVSEKNGRFDA